MTKNEKIAIVKASIKRINEDIEELAWNEKMQTAAKKTKVSLESALEKLQA